MFWIPWPLTMCVVHCPTNVFVVGNLNLLLVCHRTNYTCMHLPALLTSHHNLQLCVCCVLHILNFSGVCSLISTASGERLSETYMFTITCVINVQLISTQSCTVMHIPLHCYRRVIISSCDWEKAYSSWELLLHQS